MARAMTSVPAAPPDPAGPRDRLLEAMAEAVAEQGYAGVTIAELARRARVSKRDFYAHFADKEECFLAAYRRKSDELLGIVTAASVGDGSREERLHAATVAYVEALKEQPRLTRAMLVEIQALGSEALVVRREAMQRFADAFRLLSRQEPDAAPLSTAMAVGLVGGLNEIVLHALERSSGVTARLIASLEEFATAVADGTTIARDKNVTKQVEPKRRGLRTTR